MFVVNFFVRMFDRSCAWCVSYCCAWGTLCPVHDPSDDEKECC